MGRPLLYSVAAGLLLLAVGVGVAVISGDPAGPARVVGLAGLAVLASSAASRGVSLYRAGAKASPPESVGRVRFRIRPARGFTALAVALALVFPLVATVGVLVLVPWAWLPVAGVLLFGCAGLVAIRFAEVGGDRPYSMSSHTASRLLERLAMRADLPVPELVVEGNASANAWTAHGRIHVTSRAVELLDDAELEAVLAHELAHLARRDAAVMEICSAPSRVLLTFASSLMPKFVFRTREVTVYESPSLAITLLILAVICIPPAWVLGWVSRLSVLGLSRAREFSADALAATLTGRPSALASALMKMEHQSEWVPRADLRQADAYAVLCIVDPAKPLLGRLFATHPRTAARVRRLEQAEALISGQRRTGRRVQPLA